jgi:hypothetical protein
LLWLLLRGVGDNDSANLLFAIIKALDEDAVVEFMDVDSPADVTAWIGLGRVGDEICERDASRA